jgi:hypothetical protein
MKTIQKHSFLIGISEPKYLLKTFAGKEMSLTFAIPKSSLEEFICLGVVHKSE